MGKAKKPERKPISKDDVSDGVFMGIDQSLNGTGICVISTQTGAALEVVKLTINGNKGTPQLLGHERLKYIASRVLELIRKHSPDKVALEGISFASSGRVLDLSELLGVLKYEITENTNLKPMLFAPQSVKRLIAGNGRAEKDEVQMAVKSVIDYDFKSFDESDACALALCAAMKNVA